MHRFDIKPRFVELDPYNHVNHAFYVQYFEAARVEVFEEIGVPLEGLAEEGFQSVVTELDLRFLLPAGAGEVLTVETDIAEVGRASSRWNQRIVRHDDLLVTGALRAAITDRNGRPCRPPERLMKALKDAQ